MRLLLFAYDKLNLMNLLDVIESFTKYQRL